MKLNTARGPLIFTEESTSESEDRVDVPLKISKSKPKLKKSMTSLFDVKVEARLPSNNDLGLLIKGAQFKEESGHFCEAFEEYNKALVFMKTAKVKDKLSVIEINIGISRIFIHEELYADALTTLNKAYSIASKMPSALNKLVECYTMFAETSLGLKILYKAWQEITYALKLSEKLSKGENKMIVSDLHKVLGKIYIAKGQANEALSCFRKAIALKGTICSSLRANAEMNHLMALAYIQLTSFLEAENLLNQAAKLFRESQYCDKEIEVAKIILSFVDIKRQQQSLPKAYDYATHAVKLLNDGTEKAKSRVMAKAYQLRGSLYSERKKFGKALTEYLKAKDIMIELYGPNSLQMTDVYIDLSKIYLEQEDPQKAIRYYKHATELNESYFGILDFKMVEFYSNLAIMYLQNDKINLGHESAKAAINVVINGLKNNATQTLENLNFAPLANLFDRFKTNSTMVYEGFEDQIEYLRYKLCRLSVAEKSAIIKKIWEIAAKLLRPGIEVRPILESLGLIQNKLAKFNSITF